MRNFEDFTSLYSLSKTLRFELKPIGATAKRIEQKGLIADDLRRSESYVQVKELIDSYHKDYIEKALADFCLHFEDKGNEDSLSEYYFWYSNRNDESRKVRLATIQDNLRKQISKKLKADERYKRIDKKELIKEDLLSFVQTEEEKLLVNEFKDFTTYFNGFHENRQNMYSDEAKSTAIAYRLIHENLPKFVDNMATFAKVMNVPEFAGYLEQIYKDFEPYLNVNEIAEMFNLDYYNVVLTQSQIDVYNAIIGGRAEEQGKQNILGLNQYINQYNQIHKKDKSARLPKLKPLFKQILSDKEAISWLPESFKSPNEVLEAIEKCYQKLNEDVFAEDRLKQLLTTIADYDLGKIYVTNDQQLTDLSQKTFGSWSVIQKAIEADVISRNPRKRNEDSEKYTERVGKLVKKNDSFSIAYINGCVQKMYDDSTKCIELHFVGCATDEQGQTIFSRVADAYNDTKELLNTPYPEEKNLANDKANIEKIKNLLDAIKELQHFIKPLCGKGNEAEKDERFYGEFIAYWNELNEITALYNKVRNYATQKPYSEEKFKLNFENKGQFLGGWVDSKTDKSDNGTQAGGYLFRKKNSIGEYDYFLGISADAHILRNQGQSGTYERLDYYQPKSMSIYGNSYVGENGYDEDKEILLDCLIDFAERQENKKLITEFAKIKEDQKTPSRLFKIIRDSYPELYVLLCEDPIFEFNNRRVTDNLHKTICSLTRIPKASEYSSITFDSFVDAQNAIDEICKEKVFAYFSVSDEEINNLQNRKEKPLYLFQIVNKDLTFAESFTKGERQSRGTDNLHTIYFKELMRGGQTVLDIGTGMVFYRKETKGLKKDPTHKANEPIENKNPLNEKRTSTFKYDLVKNKRYTVNKFLFHLSIVQNYQQPKAFNAAEFNRLINEYLKLRDDIHIIGIDRGERHLLYLSLIDMKGNVVKQMTLNEIINEHKGKTYKTDYHGLLLQKEKKRDEERKSWNSIESIKDLKEGYLSQVVHKIAEMIVEYNAIVVLEDLNIGFMRGRQKVERQVYQKFEKMLIDKLNYLVDKKKDATEVGGALNALQLTSKFESFQKLGKQSGILFYVPAWNTSKMDPTTGFVNLFDTSYTNVKDATKFFKSFDAIRFNKEKNWFEFEFDYNNFTTKAEGTQTHWTLCTNGERIETFHNPAKNNEWDCVKLNLTDKFKACFEQYGISLNDDIKSQITEQESAEFFKTLLHYLKLTLQMRNSYTDTKATELHLSDKEKDYLISPVMNSTYEFYDSRNVGDNLPDNADANGAYNIARKGLWVIDQIKNTADLKKVRLAISNKEWLAFAQTKPYLND